ncbi:hypothetical protein GYB59_13475 [bacterium]|nr:hypothetical protein [bacterium]
MTSDQLPKNEPTRMDKIRELLAGCNADDATEILLALAADFANRHYRNGEARWADEMRAIEECMEVMQEVFMGDDI